MSALTRGLGWFSLALGAVELAAPDRVAGALGLGSRRLVRGYGLREIATGAGLLAAADPRPFVWARLGGDALDLGTLATGLGPRNPRRAAALVATLAVLGVAAVDLAAARQPRRRRARRRLLRDYARRSGMPRPANDMRGAAAGFDVPKDFRIPPALRPWGQHPA